MPKNNVRCSANKKAGRVDRGLTSLLLLPRNAVTSGNYKKMNPRQFQTDMKVAIVDRSNGCPPLFPLYHQTVVLTATLYTVFENCGQNVAFLLFTFYRKLPVPYPIVVSSTPYGHLFFQSSGLDPQN